MCHYIVTFVLLALVANVLGAQVQPSINTEAHAPIPLSELGEKATADDHGDAIGIECTGEGARLHMTFQKLVGTVNDAGLGARVGIDPNAALSENLLKHTALIGGQVAGVVGSRSGPAPIVHVMIPLTQMEVLTGHADMESISPTRLSVTKSFNPGSLSQLGIPRTKP